MANATRWGRVRSLDNKGKGEMEKNEQWTGGGREETLGCKFPEIGKYDVYAFGLIRLSKHVCK